MFDEPNPFIVLAEDLKIQGKISGLSDRDLELLQGWNVSGPRRSLNIWTRARAWKIQTICHVHSLRIFHGHHAGGAQGS